MTERSVTVTFDFHNTIARADRWFELEVRDLAAAYITRRADERNVGPPTEADIDRARAIYRHLRADIAETGIEQDALSCLQSIGADIGLDDDLETMARIVDDLMRETLDDGVVPMPGVVQTIDELAAAGARLGVISSAIYPPFLEWTLERFGIRSHFEVVTTSASAGFYKSRSEIYTETARALGAAPNEVVHIGDSHRFDVIGAQRAGFRTVWINWNDAEPAECMADQSLQTLVGAAPAVLSLVRSRQNPVSKDD